MAYRSLPLNGRASGLLWPWAFAIAPGLVLLWMIATLRVSLPYFDSWAYVRQYDDWTRGEYGWDRLFRKHGDHPSAVGKLIYFATLHWFRGNVGLLPLFHWAITAAAAAGVFIMSRPIWAGNRMLGALLALCANLTLFSAARGGVWLWDSSYQNFLPGPCLVVSLAILFVGKLTWWRLVVAALLNVIGTFSFATGFLVGGLSSFLIWDKLADRSSRQRWLVVGGWLALTALAAFIGFKCPATERPGPSLLNILDRPLMRLHFLLILLGQPLGKGTVFEPFSLSAVIGLVLVLLFIFCTAFVIRQRRNGVLLTSSLPWFACCLWGLINSSLISIGRMGDSSDSFTAFNHFNALGERWMSERFMLVSQFFTLGVVFLVATVLRLGTDPGAWCRSLRKAVAPLLTLFLTAQLLNWQVGWHHMRTENILLKQEQAMLCFGGIMKLDPDRLWNARTNNTTFDRAKFLVDRGLLPGVQILPDNKLTNFQLADGIEARRAWFVPPVQTKDGQWKVEGACKPLGRDPSSLPELILISAEPADGAERVVAIAAPWLPETYFERQSQRLKYPAHYYGWSQNIDLASLPPGKVVLRAYAFENRLKRIHLISGAHQVEVTARPAAAPVTPESASPPSPRRP